MSAIEKRLRSQIGEWRAQLTFDAAGLDFEKPPFNSLDPSPFWLIWAAVTDILIQRRRGSWRLTPTTPLAGHLSRCGNRLIDLVRCSLSEVIRRQLEQAVPVSLMSERLYRLMG